jgi:hypothetical protein
MGCLSVDLGLEVFHPIRLSCKWLITLERMFGLGPACGWCCRRRVFEYGGRRQPTILWRGRVGHPNHPNTPTRNRANNGIPLHYCFFYLRVGEYTYHIVISSVYTLPLMEKRTGIPTTIAVGLFA